MNLTAKHFRALLLFSLFLSLVTPHLSIGEFRIKLEDILIAALALHVIVRPSPVRLRTFPAYFVIPFALVSVSALSACVHGFYDGFSNPALTVLKWFEYGFLFVIAASVFREEEELQGIGSVVVISALVFTVIGLLEFALKPETTIRPFNSAPFIGETNHIAFLCGVAALFAVYLGRKQKIFYLCAAAAIVGLMITQSRSAMLATASGTLAYLFFTRTKVALAASLAVVLVALVWPGFTARIERGIESETWLYMKNIERESYGQPQFVATVNRIQNADIATRETRLSPLFGLGPGARHRIFYENQYAMWIGETGLVGFIAFAILISIAYIAARKASPLLAAILVMYIIFGLFCESFFVSRIAPLCWLLMGMAVSMSSTPKPLIAREWRDA